jgi:soluble P-type ATPase
MNQIFISSLSLDNLFSINDISTATGYRYLKMIDDILKPFNTDYWRYEKGMGSLNEDELNVFNIFINLVKKHTVKFAKKQLIQELKKHGYNIETNQQNHRTNYNKGTARNEQSNTTKQSNFYDTLLGL